MFLDYFTTMFSSYFKLIIYNIKPLLVSKVKHMTKDADNNQTSTKAEKENQNIKARQTLTDSE